MESVRGQKAARKFAAAKVSEARCAYDEVSAAGR
jgi:hypothetical protein